MDEMRRPYLVQMVELWKTMGMGYNKGERRDVQKKRISPMIDFFKDQFEDLIKNDQKNLKDLTKEIERHCKERLELRRTLNITGRFTQLHITRTLLIRKCVKFCSVAFLNFFRF